MEFIDLVSIGTFAVLTLLFFLIGDAVAGGRRVARKMAGVKDETTGLLSEPGKKANPLVQALAALVPQSASEVSVIQRNLMRAGYYTTHAVVEYLASRNTLVVMCLGTTLVLATLAEPGSATMRTVLICGALVTGFGYGLPRFFLNLQANRRVDRVQAGLPDALDLITMCITGGMPLRDSLQKVSSEIKMSNRDIAVEFEIIRRHSEADSMGSALRSFAQRMDTPDINALATLVSQTERMGAHVATAICDYSDSVRRVRRQRAEEEASKTSIRMLFPVILCLAPPIYILLMGPPMVQLRNFIVKEKLPGGVLNPSDIPGLSQLRGGAVAAAMPEFAEQTGSIPPGSSQGTTAP